MKSKVVAMVFFLYLTVYIVLLPFVYGLGFEPISVSVSGVDDALFSICISNTIFLFTLVFLLYFFSAYKFEPYLLRNRFNIVDPKIKKMIVPFIVFLLITYFIKSYLLGSFSYFLGGVNVFSIVQENKRGGWFLLVLSGVFIYFIYLAIYKIQSIRSDLCFYLLLTAILGISYLVLQLSERTSFLLLLLSAIIYRYELLKNQSLLRVKWLVIGFLSLFFLLAFDSVRQGNGLQFGFFSSDILISLMGSFLQVENSMAVINYVNSKGYLGLEKLGLVISGYSLIPSFIFSFDKVDTGVEAILTDLVFGSDLNPVYYQPNSTLTFSIPITGFAEFGYLGVFIHSLIYGVIFLISLSLIRKNSFYSFLSLVFLLQTILAFRLSVESVVNGLYVFVIISILLSFLYKSKL